MPIRLIKIANVSGVSWIYRSPSMFRPVRGFMRIGPWFLIWIPRRGNVTLKDLKPLASLTVSMPDQSELPIWQASFGHPVLTIEKVYRDLWKSDLYSDPTNSNNLKGC